MGLTTKWTLPYCILELFVSLQFVYRLFKFEYSNPYTYFNVDPDQFHIKLHLDPKSKQRNKKDFQHDFQYIVYKRLGKSRDILQQQRNVYIFKNILTFALLAQSSLYVPYISAFYLLDPDPDRGSHNADPYGTGSETVNLYSSQNIEIFWKFLAYIMTYCINFCTRETAKYSMQRFSLSSARWAKFSFAKCHEIWVSSFNPNYNFFLLAMFTIMLKRSPVLRLVNANNFTKSLKKSHRI